MRIEFFVPGIPKPGGSKRGFPIHTGKFKSGRDGKPREIIRVIITDASKRVKEWRSSVIHACREAFKAPPLFTPLKLDITFYMPYRKGDFGTGSKAHLLKQSAPKYCITKPDGLKLRRSTEDALTGILWNDDAQIVDGHDLKLYAVTPGAKIIVEEIGD